MSLRIVPVTRDEADRPSRRRDGNGNDNVARQRWEIWAGERP